MVAAELHDDFWGTDEDRWGQEDNNSEDKDREQSDEEEDIDNTGSEEEDPVPNANGWESCQPPSIKDARTCLDDINLMLKPPQPKGGGFKECRLPLELRTRLEWVSSFLHVYTDAESGYGNGKNGSCWMALSLHAAHTQQSSPRCAKNLRKWAKALISDQDALPCSKNGTPRNSRIDDEDVAADIAMHLQSLGPYIRALDIVHYTTIPEVKARL